MPGAGPAAATAATATPAGDDEAARRQRAEERIRRALACPCIARFVGLTAAGGGSDAGGTAAAAAAATADVDGCDDSAARPCGPALAEAFACYHRSEAVPRGKDCLPVALRAADCLAEHPHSVLRPPPPPSPLLPAGEERSGSGGGAATAPRRRGEGGAAAAAAR